MNRKRTLLLLAICLVVVAGICLSLIGHSSKGKLRIRGSLTFYSSQVVGRNIQFPNLANPHTIQFFTGSAFASIDLNSYHTHRLTPEFALPSVTNVEWGTGAVLFEAQGLSGEDDLYPLADASARQDGSSWWIVDLRTGKLQQVRSNTAGYDVAQATWGEGGKTLYEVLQQGGDASNQIIQAVTSPIDNAKSSIKTHGATFIAATKSGLLIQQGTALSLWNGNTLKALPVSSNSTRQPFIAADGNTFVYDDGAAATTSPNNTGTPASGSKVGNLYAYSLATGQKTLLADASENTGNTAAYQNGFLILPQAVQSGQDQAPDAPQTALLATIPSSSDPAGYTLNISPDDLQPIGNLRSVSALNTSLDAPEFAITNTNNDLLLIGTNPTIKQAASPYALVFMDTDRGTVPDAAYLFDVVTNRLTIFVNDDDENTPDGRNTILQELSGPSEDPNQVQKIWRPLNPSES